MSHGLPISSPKNVPWENTLRRDGVGAGRVSCQGVSHTRIHAARSALVKRLQSPKRQRTGYQMGLLRGMEHDTTHEEISRLSLGMEALKEAVKELTAFVFDEFEATAAHLHQQSLFMKDIQQTCTVPDYGAELALEQSSKATQQHGQLKDALSALMHDMNRMADDVTRLEVQQREKFAAVDRSFEVNRADIIDIKRATSVIDALKDTQLSQSSAAIQQKIDHLRRCDPDPLPAASSQADVLQTVASMVDDKVHLHVGSLGQRVEQRIRGVEARMGDLSTRLSSLNDETQCGKTSVRQALQSLADSLDVVCPSL